NGALRVAGAMIAVIVALSIFSLAPQARWLFAILVSGWMMFSSYMMLKYERFFYLWNVAGFATLAILGTHQTTSGSIFEYALARGLETTLGIIVYTVVTVLIWPDTNIATLKKGAVNLIATQAKIFGLIGSQDGSDKAKKMIRQTIESETQLLIAFKQSFYAKGSETYEVQESAELWEELYTLSIELSQSFKSLNNSSWGLRDIDIVKIIPSLGEYRQEIARRFELAKDILQKGTRELQITPIVLEVNEVFLKSLTPFDQLAFASSRKEFEKVANLSQKILECANNIMDDSVTKAPTPKKQVSIYERLIPDIERLKSILFIGSFTFVCFCIWFYFDPPGHMFWIQIPPTIALIVVAVPQMKTNNMIVPAILIYPVFMATDFIIMPQLSKMTELAPLLFISMFCVFYFLSGGHRGD
ncbi:MAG: FUSC family protein, partial [Methyloprofundus sp.]|nr:FUSC family protein [Methyloprofundus sp.]